MFYVATQSNKCSKLAPVSQFSNTSSYTQNMFPWKLKLGAGRAQSAVDGFSSDLPQSGSQQSAETAQPEQGPNITSSRFLVISVLEARNLVAKDYDTHSSDP